MFKLHKVVTANGKQSDSVQIFNSAISAKDALIWDYQGSYNKDVYKYSNEPDYSLLDTSINKHTDDPNLLNINDTVESLNAVDAQNLSVTIKGIKNARREITYYIERV